ncbi:MAG: hypothetical protein KGI33_01430 [Thaumarchaeota archaeon]|nr:hypothetical protein [Nitrososphaerota archaeon]
MERFELKITVNKRPTEAQMRDLHEYFAEMPMDEILGGLYFAKNRWKAKDAGVLKVGRKSIVKKEIHSITYEQAQWRLKNWKVMIANYRRLGYSYPTISRIKKVLIEVSRKKSR